MFSIWIDGDACPLPIKEIVYKSAQKNKVYLTLVVNRPQTIPKSNFIKMQVVDRGPDVADEYIVKNSQEGDIAITADIPLAGELVRKAVHVITPLGQVLDEKNIHERLAIRNLMDSLRSSGESFSHHKPFSDRDKQQFASSFDRILNKQLQELKNTDVSKNM